MIRAAIAVQYAAIAVLIGAALASLDGPVAIAVIVAAALIYVTAARIERAERAAERRRALDLHFPPATPRRNQK